MGKGSGVIIRAALGAGMLASALAACGVMAALRGVWGSGAHQREAATICNAISRMGDAGSSVTLCRDREGSFNELEYACATRASTTSRCANLNGLPGGIVGLDLSENSITDDGIAHIKGVTGLVYLQLAETGVTDRGLESLRPLASLEALDLVGTKVTQAGAKWLDGLPKLKRVYAGNTAVPTGPRRGRESFAPSRA